MGRFRIDRNSNVHNVHAPRYGTKAHEPQESRAYYVLGVAFIAPFLTILITTAISTWIGVGMSTRPFPYEFLLFPADLYFTVQE